MKTQKPVIVDFDCSDIENIETWIPDDPLDVNFWMNFCIGLDQTSGDNFQVNVVTHKALSDINGKKYLLVLSSYSWQNLYTEIEKILDKCQGYDWPDIAKNLSSYFLWEYKIYK